MAARTYSKLNYPRPWKLRIACVMLILKWLAGLTAVVALAAGVVATDDHRPMLISLIAIAVFVVLATLGFILANELHCSICRQPLLLARTCGKHVKARNFLGVSHALGIAVPALLTARFHCMHCGEKIPLGKRRKTSSPADAVTPSSLPPATGGSDEPSLPAPR